MRRPVSADSNYMTREARHIIHKKVGTNAGGHPGQTFGWQTRKRLQQRAKHGARSLFNLEGIRPGAVDMGP